MGIKVELINTLSQAASGIANPDFGLKQTPAGKVNGFIISSTFAAMPQLDRQSMVWRYLEEKLPPEKLQKIVSLVTITPEEAKNG